MISLLEELGKNMPSKIATYSCQKGDHILIAPNNGTYLVCDNIENKLVDLLKLNKNISEIKTVLNKEFALNDNHLKQHFLKLLKKIKISKFNVKNIGALINIKKVMINLTNQCNLNCPHCHINASPKANQALNYKSLVSFISKFKNLEIITLSGGEPLAYANLFKLLKMLKGICKGAKINICTNGLLLSNKNIKLLEKYINGIAISIDGTTKPIYESIRKGGSFERIKRNLSLVLQSSIPHVGIEVLIVKNNYEDIKNNLFNFLEALDKDKRLIIDHSSNLIIKGRADQKDILPSDIRKKIDNKLNRVLVERGWKTKAYYDILNDIRYRNLFRNACGLEEQLLINYDGKVYPCIWLLHYGADFELGNIYQNTKHEIEKEMMALSNKNCVDTLRKCKNCDIRYFCGGRCRFLNLYETNNAGFFKCMPKHKQLILKMLYINWNEKYRKEVLINN